jgi:hypothetical protein
MANVRERMEAIEVLVQKLRDLIDQRTQDRQRTLYAREEQPLPDRVRALEEALYEISLELLTMNHLEATKLLYELKEKQYEQETEERLRSLEAMLSRMGGWGSKPPRGQG